MTAASVTPRLRVLIVDDEPTISRVLCRLLGREYEVTTAQSADEALERLHAGDRYDVLLCDLQMPRVSGMDLHATLREQEPGQAARMIFMTGGVCSTRARDFLEANPNPCIQKPFDCGALRTIVAELVRQDTPPAPRCGQPLRAQAVRSYR
jgi:CheY-like chemotaxis protein